MPGMNRPVMGGAARFASPWTASRYGFSTRRTRISYAVTIVASMRIAGTFGTASAIPSAVMAGRAAGPAGKVLHPHPALSGGLTSRQ